MNLSGLERARILRDMLRFVIWGLGVGLAVAGCSPSTIRAQEGHACSINASDDPQYTCSPAQDLVCITTESRVITNEQEAKKFDGGVRPVWVCRWACNTTAECPQGGDICCRGAIHGKTYNKTGGCTPPGACDTVEDEPDSGPPPDTAPRMDTARPADAAADAAAPDAAAPDATPADAAAPDAPAGDTATDSATAG
jgi:hypothetical protein